MSPEHDRPLFCPSTRHAKTKLKRGSWPVFAKLEPPQGEGMLFSLQTRYEKQTLVEVLPGGFATFALPTDRYKATLFASTTSHYEARGRTT